MHVPILVAPILELLAISVGQCVVDGTGGYGGHSAAMLAQLGEKGRLYVADRDPMAVDCLKTRFSQDARVSVFQETYAGFLENVKTPPENDKNLVYPKSVDRLLVDLGMSSMQLDDPMRGFGYLHDGPLDMRMNPSDEVSAADVLNTYSAQDLSDIFFRYGELHQNKILVQNILSFRRNCQISDTEQLRELIKASYHFGKRPIMMRHFAQVFQALRIYVNREFEELETLVALLDSVMAEEGRVAFLTFHSQEDRLVKHGMRALPGWKMMTKHVVLADQDEVRENSRAKSAKLRVYSRKNS
jgi:16S rRNA (cytosine1402-N4)-methyltransferase